MSIKFVPANGSRLRADQAMRYGEHLYRLASQGGEEISPDTVLADARDPSSPTHEYFEWEDAVAADKYRREQARYLLRSIHVRIEEDDSEPVEIRAFMSIRDEDEETGTPSSTDFTVYTVVQVSTDEELKQKAIKEALRYVGWWKEKYKQYNELQPILEAIDDVKASLSL